MSCQCFKRFVLEEGSVQICATLVAVIFSASCETLQTRGRHPHHSRHVTVVGFVQLKGHLHHSTWHPHRGTHGTVVAIRTIEYGSPVLSGAFLGGRRKYILRPQASIDIQTLIVVIGILRPQDSVLVQSFLIAYILRPQAHLFDLNVLFLSLRTSSGHRPTFTSLHKCAAGPPPMDSQSSYVKVGARLLHALLVRADCTHLPTRDLEAQHGRRIRHFGGFLAASALIDFAMVFEHIQNPNLWRMG